MDSITDTKNMSLHKVQKMLKDRKAWCAAVHEIAKISNQSILKEINPEYSVEGLMLMLKLQYLAT